MELKQLSKIVKLLKSSEGSLLYENLLIQSSRDSVLRLVNESTEGYERGLLLDLIRETGRESVLLLMLLEYGLRKGVFRYVEMPKGEPYVWGKGDKFERELNEALEMVGGYGHVHIDTVGAWYKGMEERKIGVEELYVLESKEVRYRRKDADANANADEELEGAVLWFVGEVEEMRGGWYMDLGGVVEDFLGCEEFEGRSLVIVGETRELRLLLPKGSRIESERVRIVELKGVKSGEDLRDLEAYTGGSRLKGEYGYARRVIITRRGDLVVEAYSDEKYVESTEVRVKELESKIRREESVFLVEEWKKRIAKLRGMMIVVSVVGASETEIKWKRGIVEKEVRDILSKRLTGVVKGSSLLSHLPEGFDWISEEEYSYGLLCEGLKRVSSMVETLSKVSKIIDQRKRKQK